LPFSHASAVAVGVHQALRCRVAGTVVARSQHGWCDQIGNAFATFAANKNANSERPSELALADD
jgi:hypothetical protein